MMAEERKNQQRRVPELITYYENILTPGGVTHACAVSKSSFVKALKEVFESPNDAKEGQINITGVKGGHVKNSTVVNLVKGGMRNEQIVTGSDICILGQNDHPGGCDSRGEDQRPKQVTGVADGVVEDSTVVCEVQGGMANKQIIKDTKLISDGSCTEELNFFDLRIKKRDPATEPGGESYDNCIIDLRKDKGRQDKGEKSEREQLTQNVKKLQESLQDMQERLKILEGNKEEQGQLAQNVKRLQESRQDMQERLMILEDESAKQARETQKQDETLQQFFDIIREEMKNDESELTQSIQQLKKKMHDSQEDIKNKFATLDDAEGVKQAREIFQQFFDIIREEMKNDKSELKRSIQQLEKKFQDSQEDTKNKLTILEEGMREREERDRGQQNKRDVSSGNHVTMSSGEAAALVALAVPTAVVAAPVAVAAAPVALAAGLVSTAANGLSKWWNGGS